MKKLLKLTLALSIGIIALGRVTAFAEGYNENEKLQSNPHKIEVNGYIGMLDPNDPGELPVIPGDLVVVSVPKSVNWYVTAEDGKIGEVQSPSFYIKNESENVDLGVTLLNYTEENKVQLPGTLDLKLNWQVNEKTLITELTDAGDIRGDIHEIYGELNEDGTMNGVFLLSERGTLSGNQEWRFTFGGTYTGTIPAQALQPTYNMVLEFKVAGYSNTSLSD